MTIEIPTLKTNRLILRPLCAHDQAALQALNADPEVARYITLNGQPLTAQDSWRQLAMFLGHWQLRGFGMWAVAEADHPELLIGRVGAHQPEGWPDFEIGWALARTHWGRGYATETAAAAMRYAFETLGRSRVVSMIHHDNARSRAVAERLGETYAGPWNDRGVVVDLYEITREVWTRQSNHSSLGGI